MFDRKVCGFCTLCMYTLGATASATVVVGCAVASLKAILFRGLVCGSRRLGFIVFKLGLEDADDVVDC